MLREFFKRHRKIDTGVQTEMTGDFEKAEKVEKNEKNIETLEISKNPESLEKKEIPETNFCGTQVRKNSVRIVASFNQFKSLHQATVIPSDDPYFFPAPDESILYSDEFCNLTKKNLKISNYPNPEGSGLKQITVGHIRNIYFQEQNGCMIDYFSVSSYGRFGKIIWARDNRRACFCCSSFPVGTNIVVDIGLPTFVGFTVEEVDPFLSALKSVVKSAVNFYNELPL